MKSCKIFGISWQCILLKIPIFYLFIFREFLAYWANFGWDYFRLKILLGERGVV